MLQPRDGILRRLEKSWRIVLAAVIVSSAAAAIAFITGDASQVGHIATIMPGVLLQSSYSRAFEQQADDDAAAVLRRMGKSPAPLGDLLERIQKKICGDDSCGPSWLGSHPATAARAARLRHS